MKIHGKKAMMVLVLAAVASVAGAQDADVSSHPMIGEAAPPFGLEEVGGGTVSLESLKGRFVVLHFGTSW